MSLFLALHDAATNCQRDGGTVEISLRSGLQFTGFLEKPPGDSIFANAQTLHMKVDNGWATILTEEVVAVRTFKLGLF